jgi:hypothetical protein
MNAPVMGFQSSTQLLLAGPKNGQCLVAWDVVCKPMAYCGLSFHNLKLMNTALRWCWLVSKQTEELFCTATECIVGNGYI